MGQYLKKNNKRYPFLGRFFRVEFSKIYYMLYDVIWKAAKVDLFSPDFFVVSAADGA